MSVVLHLHRELTEPPVVPTVDGVIVRTYGGSADTDRWLELRHQAFAREQVGVRKWDQADFVREFLDKLWWSPERMWFAESGGEPAGTVTLARRDTGSQSRPVVHWLAVLPRWRRRGVGRLLMATLESACWEIGDRDIWLETHAAWTAAARFYESLGYRSA